MALNKGRQTHLEVPSSNEPLSSEWGKPLWYVCRLAALQASEHITEADAVRLVNYFECLHFLIPCPKCRVHYSAHFASTPYTLDNAKNTLASMHWVEALRGAVDARIAEERAAAAGTLQPSKYRNSTAPQRKYAIKTAVQIAQMNNSGRKIGCNCSKAKPRAQGVVLEPRDGKL